MYKYIYTYIQKKELCRSGQCITCIYIYINIYRYRDKYISINIYIYIRI